MDAINTGDSTDVRIALDGLRKSKNKDGLVYISLAKELELDIANYKLWTTYMYGSNATRNQDNPTQI